MDQGKRAVARPLPPYEEVRRRQAEAAAKAARRRANKQARREEREAIRGTSQSSGYISPTASEEERDQFWATHPIVTSRERI